jgi:hypothetical protein
MHDKRENSGHDGGGDHTGSCRKQGVLDPRHPERAAPVALGRHRALGVGVWLEVHEIRVRRSGGTTTPPGTPLSTPNTTKSLGGFSESANGNRSSE